MEASVGGDPQDHLLWAIVNLPAGARYLSEGVARGRTSMLPEGAFQRSFLINVYIGPQPGANVRSLHYLFELYTLDRMLEVPRDVTLEQLNAATGKKLRHFGPFSDLCHSVDVSPDGRFAVTTSMGSDLRIWEIATGTFYRRIGRNVPAQR